MLDVLLNSPLFRTPLHFKLRTDQDIFDKAYRCIRQYYAGFDTSMKPTQRFSEAFALAAELHATQVRKGTSIPYLSHLLSVAGIAMEHGATEDEAIAALLHDAVEDQGGLPTLERIRARFGDNVAEIVLGCTDSTEIDPARKQSWKERKENYLAHLADASHSVRLVSAADKLHNARCTLTECRRSGEAVWQRFNGGKEGTLWYYRELLRAFHATGTSSLVEEFGRAVTELHVLAGVPIPI